MTPSEGKDSDSSNSRKTFIMLMIYCSYVLTCSIDSFGSFLSLPPSVVVVNLIGTMKSNQAFELFFFFLSHVFLLLL